MDKEADKLINVLIMDDEDLLLKMASLLLPKYGYKVETAHCGEEVLDLYAKTKGTPEEFDIVVLDLNVVAGMSGKETIKKLRLIYPNVKAVVSSGYYDDPVMLNCKNYGFDGVMQKPYTLDEFDAVLKQTLKN